MTGVPVTVVARDCIQWLLQNADDYKMIDNVFIAKPLQSLVWDMAQADKPVDLFDKTTWDDVDFWPLRRGLVDRIALAFANNQTAENHVQMCALVRSTNVGVHRASCRVMSHSLLIRNFNERSVAEKKATIKDEKRKEKVKRITGKERFTQYANHFNTFNEEVKEEEKKDDHSETLKSLASDILDKTRNKENEKRLEDFKKAAEGPRRVTASKSTSKDMHITSGIGGKIIPIILEEGSGRSLRGNPQRDRSTFD